jgi:hypothetical protein
MRKNIYIDFIIFVKIKPFSCQLILFDDHPNERIEQELYRVDSSLIVFQRIDLCLNYLRSSIHKRPLILITSNVLGRQMVPEIHSVNQLNAVFIYFTTNGEKIKWTLKYEKV